MVDGLITDGLIIDRLIIVIIVIYSGGNFVYLGV